MFILQSLASHTLLNVLNGRNLSDQLHSTQAQHPELSGAERAALLDLCYGTLRHYGWLQATLARLLFNNSLILVHQRVGEEICPLRRE